MTFTYILPKGTIGQWRKSWGAVPSKVLTGGTAVLIVPPIVQASEGHSWVLLREIS